MLTGTFAFANNTNGNIEVKKETKETASKKEGEKKCYVRFCWQEGVGTRKCTEWQEIPCHLDTRKIERIEKINLNGTSAEIGKV